MWAEKCAARDSCRQLPPRSSPSAPPPLPFPHPRPPPAHGPGDRGTFQQSHPAAYNWFTLPVAEPPRSSSPKLSNTLPSRDQSDTSPPAPRSPHFITRTFFRARSRPVQCLRTLRRVRRYLHPTRHLPSARGPARVLTTRTLLRQTFPPRSRPRRRRRRPGSEQERALFRAEQGPEPPAGPLAGETTWRPNRQGASTAGPCTRPPT